MEVEAVPGQMVVKVMQLVLETPKQQQKMMALQLQQHQHQQQ
jgi:hypothetical protein